MPAETDEETLTMIELNRMAAIMGSLTFAMIVSDTALGEDCSRHLDELQQTLDNSGLASEQVEPIREELNQARQLADDGDEAGCSAATAKLVSAMLQTDGIELADLCDRLQSEEDIGEAGMSGNQDVQSALQASCGDSN